MRRLTIQCLKCKGDMLPETPLNTTYICPACNTINEEGDCSCQHSHYDHIGWRANSSDKRVSCRIIGCGCEAYTESTSRYHEGRFDSTFDPTNLYGKVINYTGKYTAIPQLIKDDLQQDARKILPNRQYYEIRGSIPQNHGLHKELCWIYTPDMAKPSCHKWISDLDPPALDQALQCYIIGGYFA